MWNLLLATASLDLGGMDGEQSWQAVFCSRVVFCSPPKLPERDDTNSMSRHVATRRSKIIDVTDSKVKENGRMYSVLLVMSLLSMIYVNAT